MELNLSLSTPTVLARQPTAIQLIAVKENPMSESTKINRVLSRVYGRELTAAEVEQVTGAILTHVCTFDFTTCTSDGDGCGTIPQCP